MINVGTGISNSKFEDLDVIKAQVKDVFDELVFVSGAKAGSILVVGCSSSEVAAYKVGTFSSEEIGTAIAGTFIKLCEDAGMYLAAQCCEHLNRALIVERELAEKKNLEIVSVVPKLKAGGSFATAAYLGFKDPVAVEVVSADLGIDIGDTLIGMHLKRVAVPVRTTVNQIGAAHVVCASTRPKYIGGERAEYI